MEVDETDKSPCRHGAHILVAETSSASMLLIEDSYPESLNNMQTTWKIIAQCHSLAISRHVLSGVETLVGKFRTSLPKKASEMCLWMSGDWFCIISYHMFCIF